MEGMVFDDEGGVGELADLAARRWRLDMVEVIESLGSRHVVGHGADPADTRGDLGHVLGPAALGELLEPPQLGDLKVGPVHAAVGVQEDLDAAVALQAGYGVDDDRGAHGLAPFPTGTPARRCSCEEGKL